MSLTGDDLLCGSSEDTESRSQAASSQAVASVVLRIEIATSADTKVGAWEARLAEFRFVAGAGRS